MRSLAASAHFACIQIVLTWEHGAWACDHFWDRPERPHAAIQACATQLEHFARVVGERYGSGNILKPMLQVRGRPAPA